MIWLGGTVILVLVLGGVWLFLRGERAGAAAAERDQARAAAEALDRMADAEANAPRSRADLVKRLRDGGGL